MQPHYFECVRAYTVGRCLHTNRLSCYCVLPILQKDWYGDFICISRSIGSLYTPHCIYLWEAGFALYDLVLVVMQLNVVPVWASCWQNRDGESYSIVIKKNRHSGKRHWTGSCTMRRENYRIVRENESNAIGKDIEIRVRDFRKEREVESESSSLRSLEQYALWNHSQRRYFEDSW